VLIIGLRVTKLVLVHETFILMNRFEETEKASVMF
jgi:hypothetical protein